MTSHDGRYVFTAGGEDCCVFQWRVNSAILDAHLRLGGTDMNPFYELLEGGRSGEFYKEMEEQFYYAQLRSQGVEHSSKRQVCLFTCLYLLSLYLNSLPV